MNTRLQQRILARVLALVAVCCVSGTALHADGRNPGSLILFPEFDSSPGHNTLLTVTNTKLDAPVRVHFQYVSGETATLCEIANRFENLSAGDTLSVLVSAHNPGVFKRGYVYLTALDATDHPISFNFLIGDVIQLDAALTLQHAINPLPFRAVPAQGLATDLDLDGIRDFNGAEYEQAPNRIVVPRFLGQGGTYQSELVLVSLTGGKLFNNIVMFLLYNDNEEVFSAQFAYRCWTKKTLLEINFAFSNDFLHVYTNDAPGEIVGLNAQEAGWFTIDGVIANSTTTSFPDPALFAVLIERGGTDPNARAAEAPFTQGKQPLGDLLPSTTQGDSN